MASDPTAARAARDEQTRRQCLLKLAYSLGHTRLRPDPVTGDIRFRSVLTDRIVTITLDGRVRTAEPVVGRTSAVLAVEMDDDDSGGSERTGR